MPKQLQRSIYKYMIKIKWGKQYKQKISNFSMQTIIEFWISRYLNLRLKSLVSKEPSLSLT